MAGFNRFWVKAGNFLPVGVGWPGKACRVATAGAARAGQIVLGNVTGGAGGAG